MPPITFADILEAADQLTLQDQEELVRILEHRLREQNRKKSELAADIQETLTALSNDPFQPRLRTHKLKGELKDSYACSAGTISGSFSNWCNTNSNKPSFWKPLVLMTRFIKGA